MAKLGASDPQSANEYDDRTTTAVKSVLVEIGCWVIGPRNSGSKTRLARSMRGSGLLV
jgi:hypothetical protein